MRMLLMTLLCAAAMQGVAQTPVSNPVSIQVDLDKPQGSYKPIYSWFGYDESNYTTMKYGKQLLGELHDLSPVPVHIRAHHLLTSGNGVAELKWSSSNVYSLDANGKPVYNFTITDQTFDEFKQAGIRPMVELGFMPKDLAATVPGVDAYQVHYPASTISGASNNPPKDYAAWGELIRKYTEHLVQRYGKEEVSTWYFEVWNEPNLDFWAGDPKQATYWDLYDHTARAIKSVNPRLRIGGPATAQAAWVDAFIKHCADNNVPVDFASTHVYANDLSRDVFGTNEDIPRDKMVSRAVSKVHDQIEASSMPKLPLIWSEFNASYKNEPEVTDSIYMGPWLADMIRQCDGLVNMMSYWTFSDVFEEQGVVKTPFYGGYGLIAAYGIPKPAYNAFKLLHKLGDQRIALDSDSALLTRRGDGTWVLAVWNYAPPEQAGLPRTLTLRFQNTKPQLATLSRLDSEHGDFHSAYEKMGSPRYPTQTQIQELRRVTELPDPQIVKLQNDELNVTLPAHGLALIEVK